MNCQKSKPVFRAVLLSVASIFIQLSVYANQEYQNNLHRGNEYFSPVIYVYNGEQYLRQYYVENNKTKFIDNNEILGEVLSKNVATFVDLGVDANTVYVYDTWGEMLQEHPLDKNVENAHATVSISLYKERNCWGIPFTVINDSPAFPRDFEATISSICARNSSGMQRIRVTVYSNQFYGGASQTFNSDRWLLYEYDLTRYGWDNRAKSVKGTIW